MEQRDAVENSAASIALYSLAMLDQDCLSVLTAFSP